MGKKLGIIAMVIALITVALCIVAKIYEPQYSDEEMKEMSRLASTDQEAFNEIANEIEKNAPAPYRISNLLNTILSWIGIIVAIVSLVKLSKAKEKGKIIPILAIIIILFEGIVFSYGNLQRGMKLGLEVGMELEEENQ